MRNQIRALWLASLALALPSAGIAETVTVAVQGINSRQGQVICRLFKPDSAFPRSGSFVDDYAPISGAAATCVFKDVAPGTYAIAIAHDRNRNKKLDSNFLGIPAEGYGFSNNLKPRFSAPKFAAAAFRVGPQGAALTIAMRY